MSVYNFKEEWNAMYNDQIMAWPSENVIRIFKGNYPTLSFNKEEYKKSKILDIGCGDGRNLRLLKSVGFNIYGVEVTDEICNASKNNLKKLNIKDVEINVGTNDDLPFEDNFFEYVLSWNASYYMGADKNMDFKNYVEEYARILKKDGKLILSIPKSTCFIYKNCIEDGMGYCIITEDPFNCRKGERMRIFKSELEIEEAFSPLFKNFIFSSVQDEFFGYNYHWHIVVCEKK